MRFFAIITLLARQPRMSKSLGDECHKYMGMVIGAYGCILTGWLVTSSRPASQSTASCKPYITE
jgi:hypothetical protein